LEVVYEGDEKVKEAKLQTYTTQFENLKMKEEENIVEYFHRVDEVVNSIRAIGEELEDKPIVKKILRSLPMRYDAKISIIEDRSDLDTLTVDQLHGIFTAYEMRTRNGKSSKNETTFKASKMRQEKNTNDELSYISDEETAKFIKKLKKGIGKYKGKIPLICFNYGKIGHFANKCPYPKKEESDDERTLKNQKKTKTNNEKKFYKKKKTFFTQEDNRSSEENEEDELELLFMGIKIQDDSHSEDEEEVNLEEEILSVIEELRKTKKQNRVLREELIEIKEATKSREREVSKTIKESKQIISDLKSHLLETNKIGEVILQQLNDKKQVCEKLEAEIKLLKGEIEKEKKGSQFENSSKILDKILSSQISPNNKTDLGYTQDSTATLQGSVKKQISYADTLKNSLKKEDNQAKMIPLKTVTHKHKSILPTRVKMTRKIQSSEGIPLNIYLLDIVTLAIILDIRQHTANIMDNTIIEMTKDIRTMSTV
jgi:hypothetical protein